MRRLQATMTSYYVSDMGKAIAFNIQTPERVKFVVVSDSDGNEIHVVEFDPAWVRKKKYKTGK